MQQHNPIRLIVTFVNDPLINNRTCNYCPAISKDSSSAEHSVAYYYARKANFCVFNVPTYIVPRWGKGSTEGDDALWTHKCYRGL